MKKKINAKFMLISVIAVVITGISAMILFYNILITQIYDDLRTNARVILAMNENLVVEYIPKEIGTSGLRITIIDTDGTVEYDSFGDENQMENHADREEILLAKSRGEGVSMRQSKTSHKHTFYYAIQTEQGKILRIAKDSSSIYVFVMRMTLTIILVGALVLVLCLILAHRLTQKIIRPIEKMADNIVLVEEESVYEEMRPFVKMIKGQHVDILQHAKMRQEFTANVSHELKTPLTAISGYAELIENGMTSGENTLHFASEIHRSAERLQHLINDIIKLSELDDSDLQLEFEEIDLAEAIKNCAQNMQLFAQKADVTLSAMGDATIIVANKMLIDELLYNLCSNAIRYNKRGGSVTMHVGLEGDSPVLTVKDTGIGIPAEQQERVFERFYRVDKSRSKSTGGTGLGLAIVKHIVAQHGAQITLRSEEGVGTEIKVIF